MAVGCSDWLGRVRLITPAFMWAQHARPEDALKSSLASTGDMIHQAGYCISLHKTRLRIPLTAMIRPAHDSRLARGGTPVAPATLSSARLIPIRLKPRLLIPPLTSASTGICLTFNAQPRLRLA